MVSSQTTILEDGNTQFQIETAYDTNGNLQSSKEHDWGRGAPGGVLRTTTLTYLPPTGAYAGLNIINKVTEQTVADSSGKIKSRTDITYDDSNFINANCLSGAAQHDDADYGCSYTTRGLATSLTTGTSAARRTDAPPPSGAVKRRSALPS